MTHPQLEESDPSNSLSRVDTPSGVDILVSRTQPWTVVVSLVGEHDLANAGSLERLALAQLDLCDRLVIDLSQAVFIDSSVINALVRVARQSRPRGVTFQLVAAPETHVHRVLDLMGLLDHLGCIGRLPDMQAVQRGRRIRAPRDRGQVRP